MSTFERMLTPEMIELLATPEGKAAIEALASRYTLRNADPLYVEDRALFGRVQGAQVAKRANKCLGPIESKPINLPDMIERATAETVERMHYINFLKGRGDRLTAELELGRMAVRILLSLDEMRTHDSPRNVVDELECEVAALRTSWALVYGQG